MEKTIEFNKLNEEDVGITEYTGKDLKGFNCILKHRYSDFLVNEIDTDGNVVWSKTTFDKSNNDNEEKNNVKIESEEDVDLIIERDFKDILNEKDILEFKDFLYNYLKK